MKHLLRLQGTVDRLQGKRFSSCHLFSVSRYLFSVSCYLSTVPCILVLCGCSFLADRLISTTSPRRTQNELEHNERLYTATADKIGPVDSTRQVEAMMELARMFQGLPGVDGKLKAKVILKAMAFISDSLDDKKLDFYKSMLGEAFSSGEPSKFLAMMQMFQMAAFKKELDERLPQMLDAAEKGLNWPPIVAAGGGIFATLLGAVIYFARLLHKSTPVT